MVVPVQPQESPVFLFIDEGGNFDFSEGGTRFFTLTAYVRPTNTLLDFDLHDLKFQLLTSGVDIESFHASQDSNFVRDRVFEKIVAHASHLSFFTLVLNKAMTTKDVRHFEVLYPLLVNMLVQRVLERTLPSPHSDIVVVTATLPLNRRRQAVEKGIKSALAGVVRAHARYYVYHHSSKSCIDLQVADYANWAIFRHYTRGSGPLNAIRGAFRFIEEVEIA